MKIKHFRINYAVKIIMIYIISNSQLYSQENVIIEDNTISNIFNYGNLINTQTTETTAKGSFELRIQHRFGALDLKDFGNTVVQEFLGFDGSANIRFGFSFGLSDNFQVGIGRTKIDKNYDLEAKYKMFKQRETGMPISAGLYFNTAISTIDFPEVGPNEFFEGYVTPFEYKFAHRLSYTAQILLSKKIGEKLSMELNPTFIYNNLVPQGYKNLSVGATFGGRFRTGITSSILFEYTAKFNNNKSDYKNPISLGYEIGTSGHAFQIIISSTNQIIEQYVYSASNFDYTDSKFVIGFNIKRTFWNGKK